jgi:hypothetical protein
VGASWSAAQVAATGPSWSVARAVAVALRVVELVALQVVAAVALRVVARVERAVAGEPPGRQSLPRQKREGQ